jgi:hypothetical protein
MAVAVSPNDAIIAGRNPLQSKPPLPWTGAYHATTEEAVPTVRILTRRLDCVKNFELPHDQRWSLSGYAREDTRNQGDTDCRRLYANLPEVELTHVLHCTSSSWLPAQACPRRPSWCIIHTTRRCGFSCVFSGYGRCVVIGRVQSGGRSSHRRRSVECWECERTARG